MFEFVVEKSRKECEKMVKIQFNGEKYDYLKNQSLMEKMVKIHHL